MDQISFRTWLEANEAADIAIGNPNSMMPNLRNIFNSLLPQEPNTNKAWWRYGNYCGPGPKLWPKSCDRLATGDPLPEPINKVDATCQVHDIDYCQCGVTWTAGLLGNQGTSCSRQADEKMWKQLEKLASLKRLSPAEERAARIVGGYFKLHGRMQSRRDRERAGLTDANPDSAVGTVSPGS